MKKHCIRNRLQAGRKRISGTKQ